MKRYLLKTITAAAIITACLFTASCNSSKPSSSGEDDTDDTTTAVTVEETTEATEEQAVPEGFSPDFTFTTTDRDGNSWDESVFAGNELTMINFWEPWCGPCVSEMPELQRLYEDYSDRGFLIIGVYSDDTQEGSVDEVLSSSGITYPILHYTSEFDEFQTGYVPTTIFVDGEGHIVTAPDQDSAIVGSDSYDGWAKIIEDLL